MWPTEYRQGTHLEHYTSRWVVKSLQCICKDSSSCMGKKSKARADWRYVPPRNLVWLGTIIIIGPGLDSAFVEDHLGLESDELVGLDWGDEDLHQALRSPSPGGMEAGDMIPDGLSNPDESSDEVEITDDSKLQWFASALQDAQQWAIQLEKELAKQKKKTPKTYLRNLVKTLAHHKKACQVLASQGFHNVFSFMAMKERDNEATWGCVKLDDPLSAVGSLAESSPIGMLVDSPIGSLLELSPIGMLVDSCGGSLSESSPIGMLVIHMGACCWSQCPLACWQTHVLACCWSQCPLARWQTHMLACYWSHHLLAHWWVCHVVACHCPLLACWWTCVVAHWHTGEHTWNTQISPYIT